MKSRFLLFAAMAALLDMGVHASRAAVPQILNYQGRIVSNGTNFNGTGQFKFVLINGAGTPGFWNNSNGANASISEPASAVSVPVVNGLYSVLLGDTNISNMATIPTTVFNNADVRLRVWFNNGTNGFQMLTPDQRIAAVGYALMAATVSDGAITGPKLANGAVTGSSLASASVTSTKIADNSITTTKLADRVITAAKVSQDFLAILASNSTVTAFGNCTNCARVEVWGDENSCRPTITLDGCEKQLRMSGPFANDVLVLDSTAWGSITLKDHSGDTSVTLGYAGLGLGGEMAVYNAGGATRGTFSGVTDGGRIQLFNANGTATVTIDANQSGSGRVITQVLEITGGADLSENFDINSASAELAGMIVCIDPRNPGQLMPSSKAYDRTVAGIVSGAGGVNPGMLMGQRGTKADGKHPVALTGRVYCMVDADQGAIHPGDLITTSDTPGHGMKAADASRAPGAVIGKAMTGLGEGKGMVLVLVSLQ